MGARPTAEQVVAELGLRPLPGEGGMFRSTYRSALKKGGRAAASAIYYLLAGEDFSHLHRLDADEVYHFYLGDAVELLHLAPDGGAKRVVLGPDILNGQTVQHLVPAGHWQGSRLVPGGGWALLGTTMAPGYEQAGYQHGRRAALAAQYPAWRELIAALTEDPAQ